MGVFPGSVWVRGNYQKYSSATTLSKLPSSPFLTLKSSVCIQMSTLENRWLWIEEYEKSNCYLVLWTKRKLKALKVLLEKWNRQHMVLSYKPNFMLRLYTVLPFKWKIKASCGQENKIYFPPILWETYEAILSRYFGKSNIPDLHKPCNL